MSLVVNTNIASMNAQRSLHASSKELATAMERLSTGKKINSAADDAAGFAIAESMTAQVRGLNMAVKNANDGLSLAAVVENASNDVTDMLQRIRELAVQAVSDTNSHGDRQNLNNEARALIDEIDRVATSTQYNGEYVLNGDYQDKEIQVGYNDGDVIEFSVDSISSHHLGENTRHLDHQGYAVSAELVNNGQQTRIELDRLSTSFQADDSLSIAGWGDFNVVEAGDAYVIVDSPDAHQSFVNAGNQNREADVAEVHYDHKSLHSIDLVHNASDALNVVSGAIDQVGAAKAELGAFQNRLEYTVANLMNVAEFTSAARSRIQDADFAQEAANLAKAQVLQQAGAAMLAQANAAPQLALSLLK